MVMSLKVFTLRLIIFLVLFVVADQIAGYCFKVLDKYAGDKFQRENYMRHDMRADVIVLGSSKAAHHYQPSVLQDSLNMTVYNCGQRGNGVIYEYGRLATIYQRYTPKIVVVDIIKGYDLEKNDNSRYLDFLKMDYGKNETVDSLFHDIDNGSQYKMLLNCYKYNSTICDLLINNVLKDRGRFRPDGYFPLVGNKMDKYSAAINQTAAKHMEIDSVKLHYLNKIASERRIGCQLVFVISPTYLEVNTDDYASVYRICDRNSVPLLDYQNDKRFLGRKDLYYDGSHLNDMGARMFSSIIAKDLKILRTEPEKNI